MSLLDEKRKKYEIPVCPYGPKGKVVLIFRLPMETKTAGGLYLAEVAQEPQPKGILIAAGLTARDEMRDHLVELGDEVWFGRFAGYEKEVERDPENKGKTIIQMMISDVLGSVESIEREKEYDLRYDEEIGEHYWEKKTDIKRKVTR